MLCRRCKSDRLIRLAVMHPADNAVLRCLECGFLFSPGTLPASPPAVDRGRPGVRKKTAANPKPGVSYTEPNTL